MNMKEQLNKNIVDVFAEDMKSILNEKDSRIRQLEAELAVLRSPHMLRYTFLFGGEQYSVSVPNESVMKAFLAHLKIVEHEAFKRGRDEERTAAVVADSLSVASQPVEATRLPRSWLMDLKDRIIKFPAGALQHIVEMADWRFQCLEKRMQDAEKHILQLDQRSMSTQDHERMHESQG